VRVGTSYFLNVQAGPEKYPVLNYQYIILMPVNKLVFFVKLECPWLVLNILCEV